MLALPLARPLILRFLFAPASWAPSLVICVVGGGVGGGVGKVEFGLWFGKAGFESRKVEKTVTWVMSKSLSSLMVRGFLPNSDRVSTGVQYPFRRGCLMW